MAVHGYIRATSDLDIWVQVSRENAIGIERVLLQFGFAAAALTAELFLSPNQIVRMGVAGAWKVKYGDDFWRDHIGA